MKGWLTLMNDYICSETDKNFVVLMDEQHWTLNENGVLSSVLCVDHDKEVNIPVRWDSNGAYVSKGNEKIYVLEYTR